MPSSDQYQSCSKKGEVNVAAVLIFPAQPTHHTHKHPSTSSDEHMKRDSEKRPTLFNGTYIKNKLDIGLRSELVSSLPPDDVHWE